jgi:hypothetical protein
MTDLRGKSFSRYGKRKMRKIWAQWPKGIEESRSTGQCPLQMEMISKSNGLDCIFSDTELASSCSEYRADIYSPQHDWSWSYHSIKISLMRLTTPRRFTVIMKRCTHGPAGMYGPCTRSSACFHVTRAWRVKPKHSVTRQNKLLPSYSFFAFIDMNDLVVWSYLFGISEGLWSAALEDLITRMQTVVLSVVTACGSVRSQPGVPCLTYTLALNIRLSELQRMWTSVRYLVRLLGWGTSPHEISSSERYTKYSCVKNKNKSKAISVTGLGGL